MDFTGRNLNGSLEHVDYYPQSHMRIWYNTQNDDYPLHHHNALEVILCLENTYRVIAGDQSYHLAEGDILFIPPHLQHELHPVGEGARFIFLMDLDPFRDLQGIFAFHLFMKEAWLCTPQVHGDLHPQMYQDFLEMADSYFKKEILWEGAIYVKLLQILLQISRQFLKKETGGSEVAERQYREDYGKLSHLLHYIDDHYSEKITQEQAAEIAGFSRFYFSRLFKQVTNSTFPDYLAHKRITEAQSLLSTDCPITDIAFQTGFNNVSSFNRCFRKYANCSPSDYRARYRREHTPEEARRSRPGK